MNKMSECETRLLKLKRYLPFLHRTKDYLATSPEDSLKINQLIDIISNAGEQLLADTLERCENFCKSLYFKFGKEDEMRMESKYSADGRSHAREHSRYENSQYFRGGADYETPRSPSPEETKRFSLSCVPKAIPNQRSDSDLRIKPAQMTIRPETASRDNYRPPMMVEHSSRPLRTEPIEIPTTIQPTISVEGFSSKDQDYRSPYDPLMLNGRFSYEERHVSYNRGPPDSQIAGTAFPKRESRFDRYGGDRCSTGLGAGRSHDEPFHHSSLPKLWDSQPTWESHGRDRNHSAERDRSFQSHSPANSTHTPHTVRSRWDTANTSHFTSSASKGGQTSRGPDLREPASGHGPSFRNGEPSSLSNSRMDRTNLRHDLNHGMKNWSGRDESLPVSHHNYERDLHRDSHRDSKSGRNYRPNEPASRQGLLPHPGVAGYSVPNASTSAPFPQSTTRGPNHPISSAPPQQLQNSSQSSTSSAPVRREDPRLANRSKGNVAVVSPPPLTLSQPNPLKSTSVLRTSTQLPHNPPVIAHQRLSTSSSPSLSRLADSRDNRRVPIKPQTQPPPNVNSNQSSNKGQNKETETRKEPAKPLTTVAAECKSGSSSRNQDEFVSPLDSLYSGTSKSGQTGRGYGVQTYKIPKKKVPNVDHSKNKRMEGSTVTTSESSSVNGTNYDGDEEVNHTNDGTVNPAKTETNQPDKFSEERNSDDSSIPLEVIEQILKKNLPSDDVNKVLDRLKTRPTEINEPSKSASLSNADETSQTNSSPCVDTTVTSSGDVIFLQDSDEEVKSGRPSKEVTSSGPHELEELNSTVKKKGKSRLPLEVARLREDLTDFMKGGIELGNRRCRTKSAPPAVVDATSEDDQRSTSAIKPGPVTKRGRKRKATEGEDSTDFSPVPVSMEESSENLDDSGSTYSSSVEPNNFLETSAEISSAVRGQTSNRGRKKKGAARGRKSRANNSSNDPSPDGPPGSSKTRMRKRPLVPTHLSLRGRRSMYEDSEPNEQVEENETAASSDQYFQCQKCSYLGQKIIHHYVNEHPGVEIPFVVMPESEWEAISTMGSATVPLHYKVNADLLSDLSWIPARPNYTSPVQCKHCSYTTSKRSELMEHVMVHALPANCKYRCTLCGLSETNFFDMLDHIAGHTGEFRYRCNYCDFRVAHRPGIKHHMSSMHESQDGLFYTTISLAHADQLWIYGFVCRTCRFVQMTEERLERHQATHEECDGYRKVNLISLIQDANSSETEPVGDDRAVRYPVEKEKGVFLCPELEVRRNDDLDEIELAETLKLRSVSLIETLAEKLAISDVSEDSVAKIKVECSTPDRQNSPQIESLVEGISVATNVEGNPILKEVENPVATDTESELNVPNIRLDEQANDSPLLPEAWKSNTLLETIISKLVDKLGGKELDDQSAISSEIEDAEDAEDTEEVGEEEEDEEEEGEEEAEEDAEEDAEEEEKDEAEETKVERTIGVIVSEDDIVNKPIKEKVSNNLEDKILDEDASSGDASEQAGFATEKEKIADSEGKVDSADKSVDSEENEPSTDSSGFLRIESVISLNDAEEDDSLDPVSSLVLCSNVTMAKNEMTFPYCSSHDRTNFVIQLKDADTYKKMLDRSRVRNLFKCMAYCCIFSSNSPKDFLRHLQWHSKQFFSPNPSQPIPERMVLPKSGGRPSNGETITLPDFYLCSYCPYSACSPVELTEHLENIHGQSTVQCSECFFRAKYPITINIHTMVSHKGSNTVYPLKCNRVGPTTPKMEPEQLAFVQVPRYRCGVENCRFACILRSTFIDHVTTCHNGAKQFRCRLCAQKIVCQNTNYTQFFLHMNVHEIGFFQCAFCLWGSDLPTDALIHLCLNHSSMDGKLFTRTNPEAAPSTLKTLFKFWKPGLPNAYTRSHQLVLDQKYADLFDKVVIIDCELTPEEDVTECIEEQATVKPIEVEATIPEAERTEKDTVVIRKEPESEFHGFGEEEQAKAKQQTECILIESDGEEDTTGNAPNEPSVNTPNEESAEQELEEEQHGLYGRSLYMCGNIGCDETADTAAAFKDHLMVCDLARDSRLLTCRHCGKNMKLVSNLMEHLRSHGVKRFLCGLCPYRANQAVQVRKHMKTLHRIGVVDELPIGPGPGPASAENVLQAFYPREMMARLKLRSRIPNKKGTAKTFSCRDAQNIPMKSILPFKVKCAHCGYASNVRTNMIRHLSMHECNDAANGTSSEGEEIIPRVVIPDQDPVNPVPHLETPSKGKMFDKMANLAYSSHVKEKPATKERMGSGSIEDPSGSESQQPVFVPDHQRYVCGYNDCGHLTINESMLKYHLQTLHKNAVFSCPHCQNDDEQLSIDAFRNHLKMHGPKLYKCGHCIYYHWQQQDIEYHLTEKHPNRPPWQIIVRDPSDVEIKRMQGSSQSFEKSGQTTPWNCSLCKQVAATAADMLVHVDISHGVKSQYKCALCPVRCNVRSEFDRHFASKHPNQDVQVLTMFFKMETSEATSELETTAVVASSFEPLWKKDVNRLRHIRGILLEENETKIHNNVVTGTKVQQEDPVYGKYGSPSNGQFCCPKCDTYRVSYGKDLKIHLFRELDYKKFLCSICNEGSCSRQQALNHVGKQHPNSGAYIREITSNKALEDWVDKVIKIQTDALKAMKVTLNAGKSKKSVTSSPATSLPSSPAKSPVKIKKAAVIKQETVTGTAPLNPPTAVLSVSTAPTPSIQAAPSISISAVAPIPKPTVITVNLDAFADIVKKNSNCLSCQFAADSAEVLEEHVIATHAKESTKSGKQICLECGFKATPKQSLLNHQKKTKHSKVNELTQTIEEAESDVSMSEIPSSTLAETENPPQQPKRVRSKTLNPYRCKHCNFSALTEHGMNLHWQRIHSICQLPLEFECDLPPEVTAAKPESAKIYYKCQLCPVQPGLYEDMREHCKVLHPNSPIRLFRITSKVRYHPEPSADISGGKDSGPPSKMAREEKISAPNSKEGFATSPTVVATVQSPKVSAKAPGQATSGSSQTVFVVAPIQSPVPPAYACVWCQSKFQQESQVIRHHATHPSNVPLRYTCLETPKTAGIEPASSNPPKPELAIMEIRFGCPVCPKYFISLVGAQQHVGEHKQAWKCGHCVMLFGTPTLALQHWKEVHPGLQGRLESIDSPTQIVDRLSKGITLIRVQLKSLLKDKSPQPGQSQSKELSGTIKDVKEKKSVETTTQGHIPKSTAVARKSTSTNLFLKENVKQEPPESSEIHDMSPTGLEVMRIAQS